MKRKRAFFGEPREYMAMLEHDMESAIRQFGRMIDFSMTEQLSEKLPPDVSFSAINNSGVLATIWLVQGFGGTTFDVSVGRRHVMSKKFNWFYWPPEAYDGAIELNHIMRMLFQNLERLEEWHEYPVPLPSFAASELVRIARELTADISAVSNAVGASKKMQGVLNNLQREIMRVLSEVKRDHSARRVEDALVMCVSDLQNAGRALGEAIYQGNSEIAECEMGWLR